MPKVVIYGGSGGSVVLSPLDVLSTALVFWYRLDSGVTVSSSAISNIEDQSGNSRDLTQSTAAARPLFDAMDAGFNGQPALENDGSNDFMISSTFASAISQPLHIFAAFRQNTWAGAERCLALNVANGLLIYQNSTSPEISQFAGSNANPVQPTLGTAYLLESYIDGAASYQQLNTSATSTGGDPGAAAMDQIALGAAANGTSPSDTDWAELFCYNTTALVGSTQRTDLLNYVNNRYSFW